MQPELSNSKKNGLQRSSDKPPFGGVVILWLAILSGLWLIIVYHQSVPWWPDENVYLKTSARLALNGRFTFDSAHEEVLPISAFYYRNKQGKYLPQYPPGFPIILAFAHVLFGPEACIWVNTALGILGVWLTYLVGRSLLGYRTGIIAASLLAVNTVYLRYANSFMSDLPAAVVVAGSLTLVLKGSEARSTQFRFLAMMAAGLLSCSAISIRFPAALGILPAMALLFPWLSVRERPSWRQAGRDLLAFTFGFAIPVALIAFYQFTVFGQLKSPYLSIASWFFDVKYTTRNLKYMIDNLLSPSSGALFIPAMAGMGLLLIERPKIFAVLALWTFPLMILHLFYAGAVNKIGYLRYILISFPGLVCATAYFVVITSDLLTMQFPKWSSRVALGFTAVACATTLYFAHDFISSWSQRFPPDPKGFCALVSDNVPIGATILGRRVEMNTVSFFHHNRYTLISINQAKAPPGYKPLKSGRGTAWRRNIVNFHRGYPKLAKANQPRIARILASGGRVFVLVNRNQADPCRQSFAKYFNTSKEPVINKFYALIEIS